MNEIEQLKNENEKLKEINRAKSDMISVSAHQLRTSLTALKWILKMFGDKDLGVLTEEQNEFIKKAVSSNERMMTVVNDLLTYNHADNTTVKFNFQKVDIGEVINQVLEEFSGETQKKDIKLSYVKSDIEIPKVNCDAEMIRVVLQNLIENAIKYSEKGDEVSISLWSDNENVSIKVYDTGIGIDSNDKDQIFDKFFRAKNAIEKDGVGSGLGLYTTKGIVEKHKGKIWFESNPGGGTTFFVTLPTS